MTHLPGDRVTNIPPIGDTVPAGTPGTVVEYHPMFGSYGVTYDGHPGVLAMDPHEIEAAQCPSA